MAWHDCTPPTFALFGLQGKEGDGGLLLAFEVNALFPGHHQRLVDSHLFALHGQLAAQQVTEVGLLWLEGKGQREGEVQDPHVGADAIRMVDKPQIGHLFFQQLAVGLLIAAKVRRLEGGVGVAVEHKACPAHR